MRSTSVLIDTPWGVMDVTSAARRAGIGKTTLHYRVKNGCARENMFSVPVRPAKVHCTCEQCGNTFETLPSANRRHGCVRFCSRACRLIATKAKDPADRLRYVIAENDCWVWLGAKDKDGYGQISIKKPRCTTLRAHVVSYEAINGKVPTGLVLDHLCKNPSCINPTHLEPVTNKVNILRGVGRAALNAQKTRCPKGHPYAGGNLYVNPKGQRICRLCNCYAQQRYRQQKKDALRCAAV